MNIKNDLEIFEDMYGHMKMSWVQRAYCNKYLRAIISTFYERPFMFIFAVLSSITNRMSATADKINERRLLRSPEYQSYLLNVMKELLGNDK